MLRVIRNHRRAAYNAPATDYEGLSVPPMGLDADLAPANLVEAARESWDRALAQGEAHGYRNAQTTLLAPTGTIGLLMDCDTTGVEPDFALVKFKKLAGGGYFKIANQSIDPALRNLGYTPAERESDPAVCSRVDVARRRTAHQSRVAESTAVYSTVTSIRSTARCLAPSNSRMPFPPGRLAKKRSVASVFRWRRHHNQVSIS